MRIGVITFWDSQDNYGQIMQCFALYSFLSEHGHDVRLIKYKPYQKDSSLKRLSKLSPQHMWAYYRYRKAQQSMQKLCGVTRDFDGFRSTYMRYTEKVYHGFDELWREDWSDYDAFVCGSDQIWSPKPDEQLNAYFLQFVPLKALRIAYAPSFGRTELPAAYQQQLHSLLRHFDAISVREADGIRFCQSAGMEAQLVCDPTLLLNPQVYKDLTGVRTRDQKAFCYLIKWDTLFPIDEVRDYIIQECEGVHYFCTDGQEPYFEYEKEQSIQSWVSAIQMSAISFTNSFHGTVFSILSHTPFIAFPLVGESAAMNNRLVSLLTRLGLTDRIYKERTSIKEIASTPIDWDDVDCKLEEFRQLSEKFLLEALQVQTEPCTHRICFLTHSSVHHNYGGLDRVTELLTDYFKRQGAEVYYVSLCQREVYHKQYQHFFPDSSQWRTSENIAWFDDFLNKHQVDVVINQEGNVDLTLPIQRTCRKITVLHFNPNYISDNHFYNKVKHYPPFLRTALRALVKTPVNKWGLDYLRGKLRKNYRHQIEWADDFVMLSDLFRTTLDDLVRGGYDKRKVQAINNPLVLEHVNEDVLKLKEKILLYVGRIDNNFKNVDKLLDIWNDVADSCPDWQFLICGDGSDFAYNERYIQEHSIPRVTMVGQCNPVPYYQKSSVIIMSSSSEGWGMVLVEAQQYGCAPVVLNSYAAVRDIVKHQINGIVIEPSTHVHEDFVETLKQMFSNTQLLSEMQRSSMYSVLQYDIEEIGKQWIKLMNDK